MLFCSVHVAPPEVITPDALEPFVCPTSAGVPLAAGDGEARSGASAGKGWGCGVGVARRGALVGW